MNMLAVLNEDELKEILAKYFEVTQKEISLVTYEHKVNAIISNENRLDVLNILMEHMKESK